MGNRRRLIENLNSFIAKSDRALTIFDARRLFTVPTSETSTLIFESTSQFAVVRLWHLWSEYCKGLVLRSAIGDCVTLAGSEVSPAPGISTIGDILRVSGKDLLGRNAQWDDAAWASKVANDLRISNYAQVSVAVGSPPLTLVRRVRNFIVHPNGHTRKLYDLETRSVGAVGVGVDHLLHERTPGGATRFESWVLDFRRAAIDAIRH